ncbi:hypothetical protein NP511_03320 [Natrinema thermotolerans]|uniref:DUF7344 domain-containing protein n=1 Tax=Natrinema thermotolerans TaxID=121872 RepID=A0AAF0SZR4_9EURY|nr:hypothetical protein [Natrinema thermotolerans]QCC57593.1 hypothetical protein DVR14_02615 [Natrinema thermotolerans]WMT08671.1 hypothetical protein NP511_03320 [Natrinema thermotolerans]
MSKKPIAFETVLDLCRNRRRRVVLAVLDGERRPLTVNDLRRTVLTQTHQTSVTDVSDGVLTEIRLSLRHTHIPKLESEGVIEYDSERKLVRPTDRFDRLQPQLSAILGADPELEDGIELRI